MITETKGDSDTVIKLTWTLLNFASELITRTIIASCSIVNVDRDTQSNLLFSILEDMKNTVERKIEFTCNKLDLTIEHEAIIVRVINSEAELRLAYFLQEGGEPVSEFCHSS